MIRLTLVMVITSLLSIHPAFLQPEEMGNRDGLQSDQGGIKAPASDAGAITGLVLDDTGQPAADAQIIISRVGFRNQYQFLVTDAAGRFKAPGLAPGFYAIDVQWPGYILYSDSAKPGLHRVGEHLTFKLIRGGVITGRVTGANGEPIISATVSAHRARDQEGRRVGRDTEHQRTDDRGVYRMYGLVPGQYVVRVNTGSGIYAGGGETGEETPTYYPSSTRDTAAEISVRAGEEISGIDIQLREARGHAISGIVSGDIGPDNRAEGVEVKLVNVRSGDIERIANIHGAPRFAFYGVTDGEYELYAQKVYSEEGNAGSNSRQIVLRGADLVGADLKLVKYGAIAGRVIIESPATTQPAPRCESQSRFQLEEIMLDARIDSPTSRRQDQFFKPQEYWGSWRGGVVDQKGGFTIRNLESGLYRLNVNLPGEYWYVRSMTQPAVGGSKKITEVSRSGLAIKSGEKVSGVEVFIAEGAASLRGRVVPVDETKSKIGAGSSPRLQIHLLPAEESAKDDLLRYAETLAGKNGLFEFKNIAPGKYWLLLRPAPETDSDELQPRPLAWDATERARLRRDANKIEIELKACQRIDYYTLKSTGVKSDH